MPVIHPVVYTKEQAHKAVASIQGAFNGAIDFAIDDYDLTGGIVFLTLWREGNWSGIRDEFPEFIEKYGIPV